MSFVQVNAFLLCPDTYIDVMTCTHVYFVWTPLHLHGDIFSRADEAKITRLSFSPGSSSWIGKTVQLTCDADGVPNPSITLYKPDNTALRRETGKTSTAAVVRTRAEDFGDYRCQADNGFSPAATAAIKLTQIGRLCARFLAFRASMYDSPRIWHYISI